MVEELFDEEEYLQKIDKKIVGLRQSNQRMIAEIQSVGGQINLGTARTEKAMEFLEKQGIITKRQRLDEWLEWEQALRTQLQPIMEQIRQAAHANGVEQRTGTGLIVPGKGSRVPPHSAT